MLRARLLASALAAVAFTAGCNDAAPKAVVSRPIVFSESVKPRVTDGIDGYVHQFDVVNPTDRSVRIENAKAGCSCMSVSYAPTEVGPGEKVHLTLRIRGEGERGEARRLDVQILTDYAPQKTWQYSVDLPAYRPASFDATSYDLDEVDPRGFSRNVRLDVYAQAPAEPPPVTEVSSPAGFRATFAAEGGVTAVAESVKRQSYRVTLQADPENWSPETAGNLGHLQARVAGGRAPATAALVWRGRASVTATPPRAFLTLRNGERIGSTRISLASADGKPLEIAAVEPSAAWLKAAPLPGGPGATQVLAIEAEAIGPAKSQLASVHVAFKGRADKLAIPIAVYRLSQNTSSSVAAGTTAR